MIKDSLSQSQSQTFNSRIRLSILAADWRRIAEQMSAEDARKFSGNPLFAIKAVAEELGCDLSSVSWGKTVALSFVKHDGRSKVMWKVLVDRPLFTDPTRLETLLRATLPRQIAVAADKNTIREYFGPAASR